MVYTRKASGLVRGLSTFDALGIGIMTVQPIAMIWYIFFIALGYWPGANLAVAALVSGLAVGFTGPFVWGALGGSMPRSGGEYIFNSRIIHPLIALGGSFAQVTAVTFWTFVLAYWVASPSVAILGQMMGWSGVTDFALSNVGVVTLGVLANVVGFLAMAFGMRVYAAIQKPLTVIAIGGPVILAIVLTLGTKHDFISYWNQLAAQYNSLDYQSFTSAAEQSAGAAFPSTWNWGDTVVVLPLFALLTMWSFNVTYVAGEIKRPGRAVMAGTWLSAWIPLLLGLWTFVALSHLVDFQFLRAAAYQDLNGTVAGYKVPFSPGYVGLTFIAAKGNWLVAVIASVALFVTNFWCVAIVYMQVTKATFAWGLDRMGPRWMSDINSRWASPIKLLVFWFIVLTTGTVVYALWFNAALSGLIATGLQLTSVFFITGVSAILFAYRKKVKTVWESSPYRTWKIAGIPLITVAGVLYTAYVLLLLYFAFIDHRTRDITGKSLIFFAAVWAAGIIWFLAWSWRSKRVGIDVTRTTYGQLPPE